MTLDLVYFDGCPHVEEARSALRDALATLPAERSVWREWRSDDPELPHWARGFGSPTIFVDGREVTGATPGASSSACRLYRDPSGAASGAPPVATIVRALDEARP